MPSIGVRELRQNASAVLREVERGKRFEVTDRGRPVAVLGPVREVTAMERLRDDGDLEPAEGDLNELPPPIRVSRGRTTASSLLRRLRADER